MSTNDKEHSSYVDKVREETQSYVRRILTENSELRSMLVELKAANAQLSDDLRQRTERQAELDQQLLEVHTVHDQYLAQYNQLEQHNANLANLYVASYQLHGTLDRAAVLGAMQEIIVNLIGSEEFAIAERDDDGEFQTLVSFGLPEDAAIDRREPQVSNSVTTGELWIRPEDDHGALTASIPLKLDGRVTGFIAIYRLLPHKQALEPLDHELFDLLATHAATALYCTSLAEKMRGSERLSA